MAMGPATSKKMQEVVDACRRYGDHSIVVLSGVAGTGKTLIAAAAAQVVAGHPIFVRQIQFHQSYSYEDFIEGLAPTASGGFEIRAGLFLDWNRQALSDPDNQYVLLVEELTRTNITGVLGELMTYIEHRDRVFELPISRQRISVAPNLVILATMNPRDRSALEVDDALIRRLRLIDCPPDADQLREMLKQSLTGGGSAPGEEELINQLVQVFEECRVRHPETFAELMPFGHGMFAGVTAAADLRDLWHQRIRHVLKRPLVMPHPFAETIEDLYPWKDAAEGAPAVPVAGPSAPGASPAEPAPAAEPSSDEPT